MFDFGAHNTGCSIVIEFECDFAAWLRIEAMREKSGIATSQPANMHLVFAGPPGSGKTTVARLVARLYWALGLLPKNRFITVSRQTLVGEHLGQTATKTCSVLEQSHGGVLFIDEAYSLVQSGLSGGDAFGSEAITEILAYMETQRGNVAIIAAGYEDQMQTFVDSNPGLASRFDRTIIFGAYDGDALFSIALSMLKDSNNALTDSARAILANHLTSAYASGATTKSNARHARRIVENATLARARRLHRQDVEPTSAQLDGLEDSDIHAVITMIEGI